MPGNTHRLQSLHNKYKPNKYKETVTLKKQQHKKTPKDSSKGGGRRRSRGAQPLRAGEWRSRAGAWETTRRRVVAGWRGGGARLEGGKPWRPVEGRVEGWSRQRLSDLVLKKPDLSTTTDPRSGRRG